MRNRIAIFHPEGNFPNNPHLSALIQLLLEQNYIVHYYSPPHITHSTIKKHPSFNIHIFYQIKGFNNKRQNIVFPNKTAPKIIKKIATQFLPDFSLIIGVDFGIIEAAWIARAQGKRHALISYELTFMDEAGSDFKKDEIEACKNISFAICQDTVRAKLLSHENDIPLNYIINMPVAGCGIVKKEHTFILHKYFNLPLETKIAVYIGSVDAKWTEVASLIKNLEFWPDDWVLLLHHRYNSKYLNQLLKHLNKKNRNKIYISPFSNLSYDRMSLLLNSCDIGLCFYFANYNAPLNGKNIDFIGMSSGKFTTYLQHGLPVIVNDNKEMGKWVKEKQLGFVIPDIANIYETLSTLNRNNLKPLRQNCYSFFKSYCDFKRNRTLLLKAIKQSCNQNQVRHKPLPPDNTKISYDEFIIVVRLLIANMDYHKFKTYLLKNSDFILNNEECEILYLIALETHNNNNIKYAQLIYKFIYQKCNINTNIAAWALFKHGEAHLLSGNKKQAFIFFTNALEKNPEHTKAAIYLASEKKPIKVHIGGEEKIKGWINININPLDDDKWKYYFSFRKPDFVKISINTLMSINNLEHLQHILSLYLTKGNHVEFLIQDLYYSNLRQKIKNLNFNTIMKSKGIKLTLKSVIS
ncbi:MAG: hypothetical protein HQK65_02515 [Desulfamplus sp.]|nr:hypothetical protein [Desulfamplus sp.]